MTIGSPDCTAALRRAGQGGQGSLSHSHLFESPAAPGMGLSSVPATLSYWLEAACGQLGLCWNAMIRCRVQQLGPAINHIPYCLRSERHILMPSTLCRNNF